MDKQREKFEAWLKDCNKHVYDVYKDGYSSSDNVENMCVEWAWSAWKQAQKSAVPEPTKEVICAIENTVEDQLIASGITSDPFRLDGEKIYKAMIEAQEQKG